MLCRYHGMRFCMSSASKARVQLVESGTDALSLKKDLVIFVSGLLHGDCNLVCIILLPCLYSIQVFVACSGRRYNQQLALLESLLTFFRTLRIHLANE